MVEIPEQPPGMYKTLKKMVDSNIPTTNLNWWLIAGFQGPSNSIHHLQFFTIFDEIIPCMIYLYTNICLMFMLK